MTAITKPIDMSAVKAGINLTDAGRITSIVSGGALVAAGIATGLRGRSPKATVSGLTLAAIGGSLIYRGASEKVAAMKVDDHGMPYRGGVVVEKSVTIKKSASELYAFWRDFEHLPVFMDHVVSVTAIDSLRSHWVAKGPAGVQIEWDAELINDIPNKMIAWKSATPSNIDNAGSVHFDEQGDETLVTVRLRYDPPGHVVGAAIAKMIGREPGLEVEEDLLRFKQLMETGEFAPSKGETTGLVKARDVEWPTGQNPVRDSVDEASEDSFPASDAPASW